MRESDAFEEKWHTQKFDVLKVRLQVSFWGAPTHGDITEFSNFLLQLKNQRSANKAMCDFSVILNLKGIMTF